MKKAIDVEGKVNELLIGLKTVSFCKEVSLIIISILMLIPLVFLLSSFP